jgi:hypothetical protein
MTYTPEQDLNHQRISPTHRYSCHNKPFSPAIQYRMQEGWTMCGKRAMVNHETKWLPIQCGHSYRETDPSCQGCYLRQ